MEKDNRTILHLAAEKNFGRPFVKAGSNLNRILLAQIGEQGGKLIVIYTQELRDINGGFQRLKFQQLFKLKQVVQALGMLWCPELLPTYPQFGCKLITPASQL